MYFLYICSLIQLHSKIIQHNQDRNSEPKPSLEIKLQLISKQNFLKTA